MAEQTRRDFLKRTGATAVASALGGSVLNGCAATLEALVSRKKAPYNTIAHDFLDIEGELGFEVTNFDYQVLDDIIDEAKKRIKVKSEYTEEEAVNILKTIGELLEDKSFRLQLNDLLSHGLKSKGIDCDNYSMIYLGIADVLNLPLKVVKAPKHVFIRFYLNKDEYINWETTRAFRFFDRDYKLEFNISDVAEEKGVFLKSLSREETYSLVYNTGGNALFKLGKYKKAFESYDKALKLDPNYSEAHNNRGTALVYLERYEEAIQSYNKALELDPNYPEAYCNRGIILRHFGRYEEAHADFNEVLKLINKALELNPKDADASRMRKDVL